MNIFFKVSLQHMILIVLVVWSSTLSSQTTVSIPRTVQIPLSSSINNAAYHIQVALPYGYDKTKQNYPVVFLLDANNDFPLVTSMARRLHAEDDLSKFIIVGISYPEKPWYHRIRDYTPTTIARNAQSGGANKFIRVISEEIIPLISKEFRIQNNKKTILGHSLGGLFGAYVLTTGQGIFDNYIISSPSMWWDNYIVLEQERMLKDFTNVHVSVGALENAHMISSSERLTNYIERNASNSNKKLVKLSNENHASAKFRAYADGLRWLFKK